MGELQPPLDSTRSLMNGPVVGSARLDRRSVAARGAGVPSTLTCSARNQDHGHRVQAGYNPDYPAVIAALDRVRAELASNDS